MKVMFLKMRYILMGIFGVLLIAAWFSLAKPSFVSASASGRELPIYSVNRDYKTASLTFDAAWGNEDTQQLIDTLAAYDVKATFFVVGDWARKYPESVKALHDAGHEVMSHSDKHGHMSQMSEQQIINDLEACNKAIEEITGAKPTLLRAPYGEYNNTLIKTVKTLGMETIQWDVDSLDWKDLSAGEITKRVLSRVKEGSIVLFHNAAKHTPEALPAILAELTKNGYKLVPVSALIYKGEYTLDHTGRQFEKKSAA